MNRYDGIDSRIVSNVKLYARALKRNRRFQALDLEDLEQELMYEVLACMSKFDEHRGELEHFVRKVLNRRCSNLLKLHKRKKRDSTIEFSKFCLEMRNESSDDTFYQYQSLLEKRIAISLLVDKMPIKYRLLYKLLVNYSIAKTSRILGVSRFMVLRDLKQIVQLFHCSKNSENHVVFFVNREGKRMGKNLSVIETLNAKELSQLKVHELADLNEQVSKLISHAKELKEKLDDAFELRFSETTKNALRGENRDTGTIKFLENGFQITAEIPKKVTWDTAQMEQILKTISEEKRKAIVKVNYAIEERKYAQLSPADQKLFQPARTVTPGKTRFQISIPEEI